MRFVPSAIAVAAAVAIGSVAFGSAPIRAQTAVPAPVTAFVNVAVIPMDRERVLAGQTVLVRGSRIVALGPAKKIAIPDDAVQVDGTGKFLIPRLGDMHVHIGYAGADSAGISDQLFAFLANGVTVVRDMHSGGRPGIKVAGGDQRLWLDLRRQIAAGEVLGPRLYTAGDPDLVSPEAAARSVVALKEDGHDFVKVSLHDFLVPEPQVAVYDSIMAAAKRVGLQVVGHVPSSVGVERVLADHWASTEHLDHYPEYLVGMNEIDVKLMRAPEALVDTTPWLRPDYRVAATKLRHLATAQRRAGVWSCPTLAIMEAIQGEFRSLREVADTATNSTAAGFPRTRWAAIEWGLGRYLEIERQVTRALQEAGVGLLLGTDVGFRGMVAGFSVHQELAALVRAGLTPYQALETGTRNVAAFLNALDSTGTIAPGKRADLVLLAGNPLQDIGYTAGPAGVMVRGRWLPCAAIDARLDAMLAGVDTLGPHDMHRELAKRRRSIWHH